MTAQLRGSLQSVPKCADEKRNLNISKALLELEQGYLDSTELNVSACHAPRGPRELAAAEQRAELIHGMIASLLSRQNLTAEPFASVFDTVTSGRKTGGIHVDLLVFVFRKPRRSLPSGNARLRSEPNRNESTVANLPENSVAMKRSHVAFISTSPKCPPRRQQESLAALLNNFSVPFLLVV